MNSRFRESSDKFDEPLADVDMRLDRDREDGDRRRDLAASEIQMTCTECLMPARHCTCTIWHLNKNPK